MAEKVQQKAARKPRILFVSEAVSLAHAVRPAMLAGALSEADWDIFFAMDPRYASLFRTLPRNRINIHSISGKQFINALSYGRPIYNNENFLSYIDEDLDVIDQTTPDFIIGDFRLSLSVSARLRGTPYATITNAYWSPYSNHPYPIPELPLTRLVGVGIAQRVFDWVRPKAFAAHCKPLNNARSYYNLNSLGSDLRSIYTDADDVLLADSPTLFPISSEAPNHFYLGPIFWSPDTPLPRWWQSIDRTRPIVFVTMGSSGKARAFKQILNALAGMPINVIGATGGRVDPFDIPPNALVDTFIPVTKALAISDLVICNGGSLMTYQSIAAGRPVLGIPSNLDQHLNMLYLSKAGLVESLRSEHLSKRKIRTLVARMLEDAGLAARLRLVAADLNEFDYRKQFLDFMRRKFKGPTGHA